MNLIYTFKIQDGDNERYEYQYEALPDDATHEEINARGEELIKELYTGDEMSDGWYWDDSMYNAGSYYSHKIIKCDECFEIIRSIIC